MITTNEVVGDALADPTIHRQWVSAYRTPESQGFYEMAFDEIVRRLQAPPDSTLLDAGCGSCAKSVLIASRGFRVIGTDFSADALGLAADTIRSHGLADRVSLKRGNLLELPFKDGEFSYALCWGVLMHVPEVERALSELARVLAPGGVLVVSEANMHSAQAVGLRWLRRLLGKGRGRVVRKAAGLESFEQTAHGALVTRQTDMAWFAEECERLGLRLRSRVAGQFTEIYVLMPWRWLRRLIHAFNRIWFRYVRLPGPAFANILILEKRS